MDSTSWNTLYEHTTYPNPTNTASYFAFSRSLSSLHTGILIKGFYMGGYYTHEYEGSTYQEISQFFPIIDINLLMNGTAKKIYAFTNRGSWQIQGAPLSNIKDSNFNSEWHRFIFLGDSSFALRSTTHVILVFMLFMENKCEINIF